MNLILNRTHRGKDGIFGEIFTEDLLFFCLSLEHAYLNENGEYLPKLPPGEYLCKLEFSKKFDRDLYELKDVPGHEEIKFHIGNYNEDSDGCILLGLGHGNRGGGGKMITSSKQAFEKFMKLQENVKSFILKVK